MGYVTLDQLSECRCARCNTGDLPLIAGHCVDIDGDYWHDCAIVRRALDRCVEVDPSQGRGGQEWCRTHQQLLSRCREDGVTRRPSDVLIKGLRKVVADDETAWVDAQVIRLLLDRYDEATSNG